MTDKQHLLTTKQMAEFAANGVLVFEGLVPDEVNQQAMREIDDKSFNLWTGYSKSGTPLSRMWAESNGLGAVWRLPQVQGIIHSLVGPDPLYDHHAGHTVAPKTIGGQHLHQDSIIDTRAWAFDVQFYYFPHDTPKEMGGTLIIPGSHFRRVNTFEISRYQNLVGQTAAICKAGTLFATHCGIWHCARPNLTDKMRYMFKLRLNPTVKQVRLWNTDDIDNPEVHHILGRAQGWMGNEWRIEMINRIKFWRYVTGNDKFDHSLWAGRLENMPENQLQPA
ncbi:MAG: phytanoyl-CoA dioxygenase family protein [Planctomycetes bacterium]|nr:phytanoyl-CoA dioxygenase family protein [Planctomycetota bacterium]